MPLDAPVMRIDRAGPGAGRGRSGAVCWPHRRFGENGEIAVRAIAPSGASRNSGRGQGSRARRAARDADRGAGGNRPQELARKGWRWRDRRASACSAGSKQLIISMPWIGGAARPTARRRRGVKMQRIVVARGLRVDGAAPLRPKGPNSCRAMALADLRPVCTEKASAIGGLPAQAGRGAAPSRRQRSASPRGVVTSR